MTAAPVLSGVIFDLDGTLAETHPMAIELIGGTIAAHGGPVLTAAEVIALFGPNEQGVLRSVLGEDWERAWQGYLDRYVEMHRLCPQPFPGIAGVLGSLQDRGCQIGLVTGKTATTGRLSLEVLGIAAFFRSVEGGSIDGLIKSDRIRHVVVEWGLDPGAVAYVGDTPLDVREARTAGVVAVSAAWSDFADPGALAGAAPDALFERVADLAAWLAASPGSL